MVYYITPIELASITSQTNPWKTSMVLVALEFFSHDFQAISAGDQVTLSKVGNVTNQQSG